MQIVRMLDLTITAVNDWAGFTS